MKWADVTVHLNGINPTKLMGFTH